VSRIATNAFWLLLAQIGGLFIPLIELPVLARSLDQKSYGQLLYALGIALMASVFVEFGFNFSAARSVVKIKKDREALAQLVTNVLFAKIFLSVIVLSIIAGIFLLNIGDTAIPGHWFVWIVLLVIAFGFSPLWYYIGIENLVFPALLDLGLRCTGLLFIILLVSAPQDAQRVLIIQALVGIGNTLIPTLVIFHRTGRGHFSLQGMWLVLRESWELFLYKGAQTVMGSIASTLLGLMGGASAVGAFVPAEKLVRAVTGLIGFIFNAAFPHAVSLQSESQHAAKRLVTISLIISVAATSVFALITVWLAPVVVNLVFGPGYNDAINILRMLVWIVPLRISSMAMAILWFIPTGKEQIASRVMVLNIILICLLAAFLVPSMGGMGMTITFLSAEATMFTILLFLFCRRPI